MKLERRRAPRIPVGLFLQQVVDDELQRGFTTNLSADGLFLQQPLTPTRRRSKVVQIELPLPGIDESLWARAEVVYDAVLGVIHGTALRFTAMATCHRQLLSGWLSGSLGDPSLDSVRRISTPRGTIDIIRPPLTGF